MILKGSQRGNGGQLAKHLLNDRENDHVALHELRGFVSEDLTGAFAEAEAVAAGTRCRQCLFSLSLNPPEGETAPVEAFETAIEMIEGKLGLNGQPRAIVFHEKDGRRHAHAVWSRIDAERMTAINLPFFKARLMEVSKEIYLEHGWEMPKGLIDRSLRNPLNFSRAEWQQAKRQQQDPRLIKAAFRQCWEASDTREALTHALEERGYFLAKGDRRGFVAVDMRGEVYALSRWAGVKTKEVKARLGDPEKLSSVEAVQTRIAQRMTDKLRSYVQEVRGNYARLAPSAAFRRQQMVQRQRDERRALEDEQEQRWCAETKARAARLPQGLGGLWSRITGKYRKIRRQNEYETWQAYQRDSTEKDALIARQLEERRALQKTIGRMRENRARELGELNAEIARYVRLGTEKLPELQREFERATKARQRSRTRERDRDPGHDGPELEM